MQATRILTPRLADMTPHARGGAPACPTTAVIIIETSGLMRDGLVGLLSGWSGGPVAAAATLEAGLDLLVAHPAAVLLLELELLDDQGLHTGLHAIRNQVPAARIIALTTRETRDGILACLAAGAHGTIARTAEFSELARAILTVAGGGVHVPPALLAPGVAPAPAPHPSAGSLTGRQRDVLRLLAEGRSTKDIARTLDLAVSTIKVHLAAVYRSVGARNRVEALCRAGTLPQMSAPLAHAA